MGTWDLGLTIVFYCFCGTIAGFPRGYHYLSTQVGLFWILGSVSCNMVSLGV